MHEAPNSIGEANLRVFLGGLRAMAGDVEAGHRTVERAAETYSDLGHAASVAQWRAPVGADIALLAGDNGAAEQALVEACDALKRAGDMSTFSTRAAELAEALHRQGRYDEASMWVEAAATHAGEDDLTVEPIWRAVRAKLLARQGAFAEAEELAREGVELVDRTECLNRRAKVRLDLAEVLGFAGHTREAADALEEGIKLFEAKGNVAAVRQVRKTLQEAAPA